MKVGIFGSSGFAREVADIATSCGYTPCLIVEPNIFNKVNIPSGYQSISEDALMHNNFDGYAIGIGSNHIRKKIFSNYNDLNWINLIHPSVTFGFNMRQELSSAIGLVACAGVRITNSIRIGNFVILNLNSTIGHDCIIENFVNLSPGAHVSGNVNIGELTWLGTNCSINNGKPNDKLNIVSDIIIGSGAVVTKNLDTSGTYVGCPAKLIS